MPFKRYQIDLAFEEPVPLTLRGHLNAMEKAIKRVKSLAVKINEGGPNEEMTVTAKYHICRHDEGRSCDPSIEI